MNSDGTTERLKEALAAVSRMKQWVDEKRRAAAPLSDREVEAVQALIPRVAALNKALDEIMPDDEQNSGDASATHS